jgi:hypothetical protein
MEPIVSLAEANQIVTRSLKKHERLVMCDVFGSCEKLSFGIRGYVRGKFAPDGTVVWENSAYKPLPQAFL